MGRYEDLILNKINMQSQGIQNENSTTKLQNALLYSIHKNQNSVAIKIGDSSISYAEIWKAVQNQYAIYEAEKITSIALYVGNSVDFCIQLLTAFLFLDVVYIFSPTMEESYVLDVCKDNNIDLIIKCNGNIHISNTNNQGVMEDVKVVLFTSGTIHNPKGVMLSSNNLLSNAFAAIDCMKYNDKDTILVSKPLYHSYGLTIEFLAGFLAGATLYMYQGLFSVKKIQNIIEEQRITVWCTIPTLVALYVENAIRRENYLRIVAVGGARSTKKQIEKIVVFFKPVLVVQLYGLSEAGPLVTYTPHGLKSEQSNLIGVPVKGVELEIRDSNNKLILEPEMPGELVVKSEGVMKGYLKNETLTNKAIKHGKLYTGDIVYFDKNKLFYFLDRKDTMISRGGINYFCSEIEDVIHNLAAVDEVVVLGIEDEIHSQIAVAFIKGNERKSKKDIFFYCKKSNVLPPDEVVYVDEFPVNTSGKIDILKLKSIYMESVEKR